MKSPIVCWDPTGNTDGLGAQLQRMMAVYGLAMEFDLSYRHTSFSFIESQAGHIGLKTNELETPEQLSRIFSLRDQADTKRFVRKWTFPYLDEKEIQKILTLRRIDTNRWDPRAVEISIKRPYPWADLHPHVYQYAAKEFQSRLASKPSSNPRDLLIAMHIPRAFTPPVDGDGQKYVRYTPTSWYREVAKSIATCHGDQGGITIKIHTDSPEHPTIWKSLDSVTDGTLELWETLGLGNRREGFELFREEFGDSFSDFENVSIVRDESPLGLLKNLVNADVLIAGRSSMSFVAGHLRMDKLTVFPSFWHGIPSHWSSANPDYRLSDDFLDSLYPSMVKANGQRNRG